MLILTRNPQNRRGSLRSEVLLTVQPAVDPTEVRVVLIESSRNASRIGIDAPRNVDVTRPDTRKGAASALPAKVQMQDLITADPNVLDSERRGLDLLRRIEDLAKSNRAMLESGDGYLRLLWAAKEEIERLRTAGGLGDGAAGC